jgi:SAM-dependent methyltransferase
MKVIIKLLLNKIPRKYLIRGSYLFRLFTRFIYKGNNVECPVCGGHFRKFLPYGYSKVRSNALCPKCLSLERHRLIWLYLKTKTNFFTDSLKVLHIAPEQCFEERFKKLPNLTYVTADLESPLADYKCDVQKMPFGDNEFDVVICNHVLEHVDNDMIAMSEIYRVMKPGGFSILLVPNDFSSQVTFEDDSITSAKERALIFGQYDHKRVYGLDYPERLSKAGFIIPSTNYLDEIADELKARFCLPLKEFMFGYSKNSLTR